jgi:para-nitrobenzyl esterase
VSARLAEGVLAALGIGRSDVERLHQVPTAQLLQAGIDAQRKLAQGAAPGAPAPNWGPVVDGRVLPRHAFDPAAPPESAGVPLLVGNTYVEFGGGINNPAAHLMSAEELRDRLSRTVGARAGELISAYQRIFPRARPFEIAGLVTGTQAYRLNAVVQAERKAAQGAAPAYMYWFGWNTPVLDGRPLAYHCQDLAFWFDNIDLAAQATGGTDDARRLAKVMSGALVAFARTGNPNHPGMPAWAPFDDAARTTMVFENERVTAKSDPDREARAILMSGVRS